MSVFNSLASKRKRKKERELQDGIVLFQKKNQITRKQVWIKIKDLVKDGYNRYQSKFIKV